jgi:phospholipid/cholesterol/gamma-HCH transport system substrate-binding protein
MQLSRDFKVGVFVVCSMVILVAALIFLATEKGVFSQVYTFTLSSKSGEGFTEGMPVVFSGFTIGKVHALELDDKGIVLIKIKIPQRHVKWIKADSNFILYRPLIGAARILVSTDNLKSDQLDENKIPEVTVVNDINDAIQKIQPLLDKITQIAENVERLTFNFSNPKGDFNRIIGNAEKITSTLSTKKSLVEMAVSDEESVKALNDSLKKMKDITINVDNILKKVDKMADKTDQQLYGKEGALPQINLILKDLVMKLQKLEKTVDNVNKISSDASEGMKDFRTLRSDIDDAVRAIEDVANKLDSVISSKKDPEFKKP